MTVPHTLLHKSDRNDLRAVTGPTPSAAGQDAPLTPEMTKGMAKRLQKVDNVGTSGRRLVVGCDGTWMNSDDNASIPSNVTRLCRALRSSLRPSSSSAENFLPAGREQIVYYHRGIGTNGGVESKWVGGGTGNELSEHARECYGFLCNNWREGDDIALFGFSRGAYTVRTISSLIADVGLLTAIGMEWFYEIFDDWKNQNIPNKYLTGKVEHGVFKGLPQRPHMPSDDYRNELKKRGYTTLEVPVSIVGVWDTVGSLGIPPILGLKWNNDEILQYSFVNTKVSQCVVHAFQALALDEHRAAFSPAIWEIPAKPDNLKTLKQCWFPGVHCSIGGAGSTQDQGLANVTLAWMVSQIQSIANDDGTNGVLDFDKEYLRWVFNQNIEHVREVDPKDGFRGWGLGKIEETMTPEYSLVGQHKIWADSKNLMDWLKPGDVPRSPGRYEEVNAKNGKGVKSGRMLKGTNEKIHCSTRIRVVNGGKGVIVAGVEPKSYIPRGLEGWNIIGNGDIMNPLTEGFAWGSEDGKVILKEDVLGEFERELSVLSQQAVMQANSKSWVA